MSFQTPGDLAGSTALLTVFRTDQGGFSIAITGDQPTDRLVNYQWMKIECDELGVTFEAGGRILATGPSDANA